jgi:hypothetical protein
MIKAESLLSDDDPGMLRELQAAIDTKSLTESELAYVEGLRSENAVQAHDFFQKAIKAKPSWLAPRIMDAVVLLSLGRLESLIEVAHGTHLLSPDEPQSPLLLVLAYSMRDRHKEAEPFVALVKRQIRPEDFRLLKAILPLLPLLNDPMNYLSSQTRVDSTIKQFLFSNALQLPNLIKGVQSLKLAEATGIRMPRSVRPYFQFLYEIFFLPLHTIEEPIQALTHFQNLDKFLTDEQVNRLTKLCDNHPEGFIHQLLAIHVMNRGFPKNLSQAASSRPIYSEWQRSAREAAQLYDRALRCEGFLINARITCCDGAIVNYGLAGLGQRDLNIPKDQESLRNSLRIYRLRELMPQAQRFPSIQKNAIGAVAIGLGEFGLAKQLLDEHRLMFPQDRSIDRSMIRLSWGLQAYDQTLELIQQARKRKIPDPSGEFDEIERGCREKMLMRPGPEPKNGSCDPDKP